VFALSEEGKDGVAPPQTRKERDGVRTRMAGLLILGGDQKIFGEWGMQELARKKKE